uniref:Uncharacterized protein n=1 Tax=Saccharum spontaneum TaxID=62335 RepID=A0A678TGY2_SACSP|nr:hypothetical protein SS34H08_000015 [Saccharum spontaneum]
MLEEDARLEHLVKEKKGWSRVARDTMMRSPRQCSDRWHEHLACDLYHRPFTVQGAAAPRSVPRRPLEGDQACNARQGLVALVLDERHGRNKMLQIFSSQNTTYEWYARWVQHECVMAD